MNVAIRSSAGARNRYGVGVGPRGERRSATGMFIVEMLVLK
jgi:hypothetical protein